MSDADILYYGLIRGLPKDMWPSNYTNKAFKPIQIKGSTVTAFKYGILGQEKTNSMMVTAEKLRDLNIARQGVTDGFKKIPASSIAVIEPIKQNQEDILAFLNYAGPFALPTYNEDKIKLNPILEAYSI